MKRRSTTGNLPTTVTELGPFQEAEPFTGVRPREPLAQQTAEPPVESPEPSPWRLRMEPEVMTSLLRALIGAA